MFGVDIIGIINGETSESATMRTSRHLSYLPRNCKYASTVHYVWLIPRWNPTHIAAGLQGTNCLEAT